MAEQVLTYLKAPEGNHLRILQTLTEIGADKNDITILLMKPVDLIETFG